MSDYLSDVYGFCIARSALENLLLLYKKALQKVENVLQSSSNASNVKQLHLYSFDENRYVMH